jgi:hypothetical protein
LKSATLKENGIDELTEDHKLIMQDFYDDIEANLPNLEGENRLFSKALRWLTQDTELANALRHSATKAKHILENLVWDMNLASECDLSMGDDEWAGLAALQKQVDQGLGSVDAFLAKHGTPGNKVKKKRSRKARQVNGITDFFYLLLIRTPQRKSIVMSCS